MFKKISYILFVLLISFSIIACNDSSDNENTEEPIVEENNGDQENNEKYTAKLYFANSEYINTGNEDLDSLLVEEREIELNDIILEKALILELLNGPSIEGLSSPIPESANLLDVQLSEATVFIDFESQGMNGGSLQESLTIEHILKTLFELEHIEKVQFLIDGEVRESLMGHLLIDEPFTREMLE